VCSRLAREEAYVCSRLAREEECGDKEDDQGEG